MCKTAVFLFLLLSVVSTFAMATSEMVSAANVTCEAASLRIGFPSPQEHEVTVVLGPKDQGAKLDGWQFSIPVGRRASRMVQVEVEGLSPETEYFFRFRLAGHDGEKWTEAASFQTLTSPIYAPNVDYVHGLSDSARPARGFISLRPAGDWTQGLLSGNGRMGAIVLSRPLAEKVLLTHERLFLPQTKPQPPVHLVKVLPQIREAIAAGQYSRASDLLMEQAGREGFPSGAWNGSFLPAVDLLLNMPNHGTIRDYSRLEDFSTGVVGVRWRDDLGGFTRRLFVSRADDIVVMEMLGTVPFSTDLRLAPRAMEKLDSWGVQGNVAKGIKDWRASADGEFLTYRTDLADGTGYQVAAKVIVTGGNAWGSDGVIHVHDASRVLLLLRITPNRNTQSSSEVSQHELQSELSKVNPDFEWLLKRHSALHGAIFQRASLDLQGSEDERRLPVEELLSRSTLEHPSTALLEKQFDAGRYTILSSSGELPPNLQGKWNGTWGPAWAGGYTLDGNLETAISSDLSTNMPEAMVSLFNLVDKMMPEFRENARLLYGARGILIPAQIAKSGYENQFSKEYPLAFWTAGAGWVAHYYYDYYLYTGDCKFLEQRALPFMKEAALFYEDFLTLGPDGHYVFSPSYSPENTPRNSDNQASINATMDVWVARELLGNLVSAYQTLGIEDSNVSRWKQMLSRLPVPMINSEGALKEWTTSVLDDQYGHRHLSHLYPLFFGMPGFILEKPELRESMRVAAQHRLDWRLSKGGGEMAFGMVELGDVSTSLGDGETAYRILGALSRRNYFENLMTSHDPGSIFNADVSGGLPDLISRLLLQSDIGQIELLPALPIELSHGSIYGILAKGGITVKALQWNANHCSATLLSAQDQNVTLILPRRILNASVDSVPVDDRRLSREMLVHMISGRERRVELVLQDTAKSD